METERLTGKAEPAISIKELGYSYLQEWTFEKKQALKNLNLEVLKGESFGFLGHNGAGKTTTIKCLLGLTRPRRGSVTIFGKSPLETSARASVGYVPEQPYFYDYLTVQETLDLFSSLAGIPERDRKDRVSQALEKVGMADSRRSRMKSLSKGLTQKIAIAQAIVSKPKLLILDEPFSGLDPVGRKEFRELLAALKKDGTTVFMSSHILGDVEFLCDRVAILAKGELKGVFDLRSRSGFEPGAFELVVRNSESNKTALSPGAESVFPEERFLRLVYRERERAEEALKLAMQINAEVDSFEFVHGNLEDLFIRLVK